MLFLTRFRRIVNTARPERDAVTIRITRWAFPGLALRRACRCGCIRVWPSALHCSHVRLTRARRIRTGEWRLRSGHRSARRRCRGPAAGMRARGGRAQQGAQQGGKRELHVLAEGQLRRLPARPRHARARQPAQRRRSLRRLSVRWRSPKWPQLALARSESYISPRPARWVSQLN